MFGMNWDVLEEVKVKNATIADWKNLTGNIRKTEISEDV